MSGLSVAGLVVGIIALLVDIVVGSGFLIGLLALILASFGRRRDRSGIGLAGIITSSVAMALSLVLIGVQSFTS